MMSLDFNNTEKYYKKGVDADTMDVENNYKFATYLHAQTQYSKSMFYYHRLMRFPVRDDLRADVISDMGLVHLINMSLSTAEKHFLQSLEIYKKIPRTQSKIAATYKNLGDVYRMSEKRDKALAMYFDALRAAKNTNPLVTIHTLNQMGSLYVSKGEIKLADSVLLVALGHEKDLMAENPALAEPAFMVTASLLSVVSFYQSLPRAKSYYDTVIRYCQEMMRLNSQRYIGFTNVLVSGGIFRYTATASAKSLRAPIESFRNNFEVPRLCHAMAMCVS